MTPFGRSGIAPFVAVGIKADGDHPDAPQRQRRSKNRALVLLFFIPFHPPATFFPSRLFLSTYYRPNTHFLFTPGLLPLLSHHLNKYLTVPHSSTPQTFLNLKTDKLMESKNSKPSLPTPIPPNPSTPLSGFKFSSIGQSPSLLQRMSDGPAPQPVQHLSQEQNNTSHARLRPFLLQPLQISASSVEPAQSVKSIPIQRENSFVPASSSLQPSDTQSDVKTAQPPDQIRASVLPDLHYPGVTPEIESPVSWESNITLPQAVPMDQDTSRSQLPDPRNLPPAPATSGTGVGASVVDGATDGSAQSFAPVPSQTSAATTPIEPEQVRRPVEHLFRLASVREESMSKRRETYDLRSSELSTFCAEARLSVQNLQDNIESFKRLGEETRAQAEQTLQEANKMRDLADRLILSAGTLGEDMLGAKNHVFRAVERSEQITRFMRKSFDWLATLRAREREKIALVQAEIAEQELAEVARRQQELQKQLELRKIEEQQKKEAAEREEAEREALRKKEEEESEAARKRSYEMRRAEVLAEKRRATQAHAQSLQAERERRAPDDSGPSSTPSARGSNPLLNATVPPTSNSEPTRSAGISMSVSSSQVAVPTPSRSPVARIGEIPDIVPPHSLPSSKKAKAVPALVSFVPAQTEAGRAVNTDLPLSSTTLASELHMRNNVEISQHPRSNQATRDPAQEQMQSQIPRQVAPTVASHRVEVKRELSAEVLPATRVQPSPDTANTDQYHHHQRVVSFSTASHDGNMDQQLPNSESNATSLHTTQTEEHDRPSNPSRAVSSTDSDIRSRHDRAPTADSRAYKRQGSVSSDRSLPRWNDRRSPSPPSLGERRSRSLSRSPPYLRKRMRSRTPYEARHVDRWPPERPRVRARLDDEWDRSRRYNVYDRGRRDDSPHRYRHPPSRRYDYRSSHSPPPPPRHFRNERSPPRRSYRDRTPSAQHVSLPLRVGEWRPTEYGPSTNPRHYEPTYEGADTHRITEPEGQPRWQQHERQRHSPSPSEHDRTPTSSSRHEEVEIGLLERISMEEADNRGYGRGRPPSDTMRGGPNSRRGMRGASSSGRGRGGGSGSKPALLSRMTESATRPARAAPAPSLSDRM